MDKRIVFCLLIALVVCGCQIKEDGEFAPVGKAFTATMEVIVDDGLAADTKTSMDANGNVLWKRGDQVTIFAGSTTNGCYQVTDASDGKTAAALNPLENTVNGEQISNNVAFYPYSSTAAIAQGGSTYVISDIALPAIQNYAPASFGNGAFPMTAVTNSTGDYNLKFKNVLGGLKLQLTGTAVITSISVTGNDNEILCGAAEVTVSNTATPAINLTDATAKTVTLDCGDGVQLNEETATSFIIALPPVTMLGGFTITVIDSNDKQMEIKTTKSQTITRSNLLSMPAANYVGLGNENGHSWVDLGLPSGLKWATCNVGASAPEEHGDYYAWGETAPYYTAGHSQDDPCSSWENNKTGYNWASYRYELGTGKQGPFSKYVIENTDNIGNVDNKSVLDPEDDAAAANWGGSWRIPTIEEWQELLDECTWTWTTQNGANGYLVTGTNNSSIFLPAAGLRFTTHFGVAGSTGGCWSSSLAAGDPRYACGVIFRSDDNGRYNNDRYYGLSVRAVTDEGVRVSVTGVSLNEDNLALVEGETVSLTATVTPSNATQPAVIWSSSDASVASVDYNGKVTAVAAGSATITATAYDGGFKATCTVTVSAVPEAVDLGLTSGLKWASCNVGANAPEEYGDYFAWGETAPYYEDGYAQSSSPVWKSGKSDGYYWASYKFELGTGWQGPFSKYVTENYDNIGNVDNNTVLDPEDDAASVNWGGTWRMPTDEEWAELMRECSWIWTTQNEVNGYLVTSTINNNSIFLPAAGFRLDSSLLCTGSYGYYWSSSLDTDDPNYAWDWNFNSGEVGMDDRLRYRGQSVRPVTE